MAFDRIRTIGISAALTRSQGENSSIVSTLWKRFNREVHKIKNRPPPGRDWEKFGITYAMDHEYHYLAAIPFSDEMVAPSHMVRQDIAPGQYLCFTHTGRIADLKATIYDIYREQLPAMGMVRDSWGKAGLIHFERYDNRFHWDRPDAVLKIYLPKNKDGI